MYPVNRKKNSIIDGDTSISITVKNSHDFPAIVTLLSLIKSYITHLNKTIIKLQKNFPHEKLFSTPTNKEIRKNDDDDNW